MVRRMKRLVSVVCVLALCTGMSMNVHATAIDDAKKKGQELENQKNAAQSQKQSLTDQINLIVSEMQKTQDKLTAKEEEIDQKEEELTQAKIDENDQYESMKKRIVFMYENGNAQWLETLLSSKDITDFLNKAEYVSEMSSYDRDMLTEFQNVVKKVEKQEAALKKEYSELSELQTQLNDQKDEVQKVLDATNVQLADLEKQIGENAANLNKLIAEAQAAAERQKQAAAAAAASKKNNGTYVTPGPSVVSGNGTFTHPCPSGYITSYFGEYRSPSDPAHKGMDFGTGGQAVPTYAAAAGTVVIAGWSNSAGNWVVINHGNGLVTKYMHHSALCVSAGQTVSKGQQIGLTGTTGNSTGVHLHFQVEVNGIAVDPRTYL